jgi:enterochelin esterase-like enzyme
VTFHSNLNRRNIAIKVYTPPGYEQGSTRYAVVYNLHGGGGSPARQWERTGETIQSAMNSSKVRPMIYVYADGLGNTLFLDYADGSLKVESMIVRELIPFIDARYRTIASHEGRAIDGFSMGGYGALLIAFRHPHLFSSVVSYGAAMLSPDMIRIGGEDGQFPTKDFVEANSPWHLLEKNKDRIREHVRIRMVCGEKDEKWYPGNVKLKARADQLKVPVEWVSVPDVAHDTKGLYQRVGLESLTFMEKSFAPPLDRAEGIIEDQYFRSALNDRDLLIKVYTPPGYGTSMRRYPVVYNLHGAGGGSPQRQWARTRTTLKEAVETGKVPPMIYVFVDGLGDTFFVDYADGSVKAESMIVRELIPYIDGKYRTVADRRSRAIDGFSMGGAGALRLATAHPDLFGTVVSYGAAVIKTSKNGGESATNWAVLDKQADAIRSKLRIRMVCGDADGLYPLNVEYKNTLLQRNIPVDWVSVPGVAHDTKGLFDRVGVDSLRFIAAGWPQDRMLK